MRLAWLLSLALLLAPRPGGAQPAPPQDISEVGLPILQVYGESEGLPNLKIYAAAWGPQGQLWIGTQGGLATFDGRTWNGVPLPVKEGARSVRCLLCASDGSMWFGTQNGGLYHLKDGDWTRFGVGSGLPSDWVNALLETRDAQGASVLWVGTAAGLARFEDGAWRAEGRAQGLPDSWIWGLAQAQGPGGELWIATRNGVASGRPGHWTAYGAAEGLPAPEVNAILEAPDPEGRPVVWASCWGGGLARFDGRRWEAVKDFPSRFPDCLAATRDPSGTPILWAGTFDVGLAWREGGQRWRLLDTHQGLPSRGVYALLPTPGGRPALWLGTQTGGLATMDLRGWGSFGVPQGLPDPSVNAIAESVEDGRPVMWFGTSGGLAHFAQGRWSTEGVADGLPSGEVNALLPGKGPDGRPGLWVGTLRGLALRQQGRWRSFDRAGGQLPDDQVNAILESADGTLWVGTDGGLAHFQDGRWTQLGTRDGLPGEWINALLETQDPDGGRSLWVGTRNNGLARLRGGRWSAVESGGLPSPTITTLFQTRGAGGRLWLWAGTLGGGLGRIAVDQPGAAWELLSTRTQPALPNDEIFRFEQDRQGRLYLSSNRGVVRLSLPDPDAPLARAALEMQGRQDGLPSRFCTAGASLVDHLGRVWVGTVKGAAMLDPAREAPPPQLPGLVLRRALVDGREAASTGELDVRPGQHLLAFEYLLPSFDHPQEVRYRTQVLGLEEAPTPWSPEGRRELTALPSGTYVFRVWARDHLGRETPPVDLRFVIRPPAWRSPLALLAYGAALGLLLLSVHHLRLRFLRQYARRLEAEVERATGEIRQQQQALEHFNERLSMLNEQKSRMLDIAAHDLRNPLQGILSGGEFLQMGELTPEQMIRTGERIQKSAEQMNQMIRRLLDVSAIEDGSLNLHLEAVDALELLRSVAEEEQARAAAKDMLIEVLCPGEAPRLRTDRFYLKEVLSNLVGNAVKFTQAGPPTRRIRLRLEAGGGEGLIEVEDQGPGFSEEDRRQLFGRFARLSARPTGGERSTGLGLSIVKALVEVLGGRIELLDRPGPGATFRLSFPLES